RVARAILRGRSGKGRAVADGGTRRGWQRACRGTCPCFQGENAMRYLLTGDEFGAAEALRIGLVQEVAEEGKQLERAIALAEVIAAQAPLGVRATLSSSRLAVSGQERETLGRLLSDLKPLLASDDAREGLASFLERRPAKFTGK